MIYYTAQAPISRSGNGSPRATNVVHLCWVVVSTKAFFSFHFKLRIHVTTTLSTVARCRNFKLSPNWLIIINFLSRKLACAAKSAAAVATERTRLAARARCLEMRQHVDIIAIYRRHRYYRAFPGPTATRCCSCLK